MPYIGEGKYGTLYSVLHDLKMLETHNKALKKKKKKLLIVLFTVISSTACTKYLSMYNQIGK